METEFSIYDKNFIIIDRLLLHINVLIQPGLPFFPLYAYVDNNYDMHVNLIPLDEGKEIDFEVMRQNQLDKLNQQLENQEIFSFAIACDCFTTYNNKTVNSISILVMNQQKVHSGHVLYDYKISKSKSFEISNYREEDLE